MSLSTIKAKLHLSQNGLYSTTDSHKLRKYLPKFLSDISLEYIESNSKYKFQKLLKRLKAQPNLRISILGPITKPPKQVIQNLKYVPSKSPLISLHVLKNAFSHHIQDALASLKSIKYLTDLHLDLSREKTPAQGFIYSLAESLKSLNFLKSLTIKLGEHSKATQKHLAIVHKSLHHHSSFQIFHVQLAHCRNIKDISFLKSKLSKFKGPISSLEYNFQDTLLNFDGVSNLFGEIKSMKTLQTLKIVINACFSMNKKCFDFLAKEIRSLDFIHNLSLDFSKNYAFESQDLVTFSFSLPYLTSLSILSLSFRSWNMSKDQISALCCGLRELKGLQKLALDFSKTKIHVESFNRLCESLRQAGGLVEIFIGLEGVEINAKKVILSVAERLGYVKFLKQLELRLKLGGRSDLSEKEMEIFHKRFQSINAVIT